MTEAILRLALTTDGGKWAPGTILGAYAPDAKFGPADMAGFKLVRVKTSNYTLDQLKAMRCRKVIALTQITKSEELSDLIVQKENIKIARDGSNFKIFVTDLSIKPTLDKTAEKDLSLLTIADADEKYMPKDEPISELPIEEEKVR